MRLGVDGRSLAGEGRGVAQYVTGMLGALNAGEGPPRDDIAVVVLRVTSDNHPNG